ncbi:MAG: type VI secretion system baseplate subunit TssG [Myxococcales bacterium]|nr:MAG: type VI secretion system baseplate subunit TssG [Myxococcales bacterium]
MADETRSAFERVGWLRALAAQPFEFDFHQALRRVETTFRHLPRWGEAAKPRDEPLRIGQDPSFDFSPAAVRGFTLPTEDRAARLTIGFLGLFGPQGPLPLHFTEYARDRIRQAGDHTFAAFVDLFHHRMLAMFHRAWSHSRAAVSHDRPEADRFRTYVGAAFGLGLPAQQGVGAVPDRALLYFGGLFSMASRPPDGLRAALSGYFGHPIEVKEFVGEWLVLHADDRFRLGHSPQVSSLGRSTVLGQRVFSRSHKFRIVMGPLGEADFVRFLPGAPGLASLSALVTAYAGPQLAWDLELIPAADAVTQLELGRGGRLGLTAMLGAGRKRGLQANVIVDPLTNSTERTLR